MSLQIMPEYVTSTGVTIPESFTEQDDMFVHGPMRNTADLGELMQLEADEGSTLWKWAPLVALAFGYWWLTRQERRPW